MVLLREKASHEDAFACKQAGELLHLHVMVSWLSELLPETKYVSSKTCKTFAGKKVEHQSIRGEHMSIYGMK